MPEIQNAVADSSTSDINLKMSKAEMFKKYKEHKDSIQKMIANLQKDSLTFSKDLEVLKKDNESLRVQVANYQSTIKKLEVSKDSLIAEVQDAQAKESPIVALTSPSGCAVLIVLIIALTAIALKKGFSISKGDAKLSVGDKE